MSKYLILLILLFSAPLQNTLAQQNNSTCNGPEYSVLDFWVGKWDLTWEGGSGTNEITKEYNDCVIHENFKGSNLKGMSISSYVEPAGTWRQIWVDEENSFLDLYGKKDGGNYIFHTTPNDETPNIQLQMVFSEIKPDSFIWTWQRTDNGGDTWQDLWKISYKRAK